MDNGTCHLTKEEKEFKENLRRFLPEILEQLVQDGIITIGANYGSPHAVHGQYLGPKLVVNK